MDLILLNHRHKAQSFRLCGGVWIGFISFLAVLAMILFYAGFQRSVQMEMSGTGISAWQAELRLLETQLEKARQDIPTQLDALSLRMGQLNADVIQLDALAARLMRIAAIDQGEFDFASPPSLGGPEEEPLRSRPSFAVLARLEQQLKDHGRELGSFEWAP